MTHEWDERVQKLVEKTRALFVPIHNAHWKEKDGRHVYVFTYESDIIEVASKVRCLCDVCWFSRVRQRVGFECTMMRVTRFAPCMPQNLNNKVLSIAGQSFRKRELYHRQVLSRHLDIQLVDSLPLFMIPVLRHCVREILNLGKEHVLLALKPSTGAYEIQPPRRLQDVFQRMVNIDVEFHLLVSKMATQMDFVERVYTVCFRRPPVIHALSEIGETRQATNVKKPGEGGAYIQYIPCDVPVGSSQGKSSERTASERNRGNRSGGDEYDSGNRVSSRQEGGEKQQAGENQEKGQEEVEMPVPFQDGIASWSGKKHTVYKRMRDPSINTETAAQELVHLQEPLNKKNKVRSPFSPVAPTLRFSLEAKNIRFAFGHDAIVKLDIQNLSNMVVTMVQMQKEDITPSDVEALLLLLSPTATGDLFCFESNGENTAEKFMGIVHLTRIRDMIMARYQLAQVRAKKKELMKETQKEEALLGQDW
jgi:hypothetical protein